MRGATQSTQVHFPSWQHSTLLAQSLCWEQEVEEEDDQNQPLMEPKEPSMVRSHASASAEASDGDRLIRSRGRTIRKVNVVKAIAEAKDAETMIGICVSKLS